MPMLLKYPVIWDILFYVQGTNCIFSPTDLAASNAGYSIQRSEGGYSCHYIVYITMGSSRIKCSVRLDWVVMV